MRKLHKAARQYLPEISIFLTGIFLYTFQLGTESFWIDEILSVDSARGPLNLNRPLYFILLRGWLRLGESDVWLRSLSVLFGLGSIILTYILARRLTNRSIARLSALLFTLSPLAINHAQEVRFYMMSTFLGLVGSLFLSRVLAPNEPKRTNLQQLTIRQPIKRSLMMSASGWIVFRALGFLTAQPNILLLPADVLLILWHLIKTPEKMSRTVLRYWVLGSCVLAIPTVIILSDVIPALIEFLSYTTHAESARPGVLSLIGKLSALTVWPLRGPDIAGASAVYQTLFQLYSLITIGLISFSLAKLFRKHSRLQQPALWGLLPTLSIFLLSQFFPALWQDRYALTSAPYVLILLAAAWLWLWKNTKQIAVAISLIYLLSVTGPLLRYYTLDYRADWRQLSEEITIQVQPEDSVIVYPGSFVEIIDYYYDGQANFVPMNEVISSEDVSAVEVVDLAQDQVISNSHIWIILPIAEGWGDAKQEVIDLFEENGFKVKRSSLLLDQWNWGPTLYLLSKE